MPRQVDPAERRRDITAAAVRIMAKRGPRSLTLKSLAEELGGSITLVTHFFSNREDLFSAVVQELAEGYGNELEDMEAGASPVERLRILLQWMIPLDAEGIEAEAGRVALIPQRGEHESIDDFFDVMETRMRGLIRGHLEDIGIDMDLETATAYLRATTNGVTLSAIEHPDLWPAQLQKDVIDIALKALGITQDQAVAS
ncbi:MAG: TetR/AcrR family transcriptional regulator [Nocardioides sp.]|uniref:TetR/AcrR family transcriptional regulator n=1 Tax=Nocardioides sp. TaxID=35761 RepID=UPI00326557F4